MNENKQFITSEAVIRSIALRDRHYMLLLGAGTSLSSGIPLASDLIWQWKRTLLETARPDLNVKELGDISLPHIRQRIQRWIDQQQKYPPAGDPEEYSFYAQECYRRPPDRQEFFKKLSQQATPHLGYRVLGELLEAGKLQWIWSTNFDDLVERSLPTNRRRTFVQASMDTFERLSAILREESDIVEVKLHGDFKYDPLKNTTAELQTLDSKSREKLMELCQQLPLIVLGYSGRDESVMSTLEHTFSKRVNGGIYWACMTGSEPNTRVRNLMNLAHDAKNDAAIFHYDGFDDFLAKLGRLWLKGQPSLANVESILAARKVDQPFGMPQLSPTGEWLLGNAYPIELPNQIYQFTFKGIDEAGAWKLLKARTTGKSVRVGLYKRKAIGLGRTSDIEAAFGTLLDSKILPLSLSDPEVGTDNSAVKSLMLAAITDSLAARGFMRAGKNTVFQNTCKTHNFRGKSYKYFDAVTFGLDVEDGVTFLITNPDVHLELPRGEFNRHEVAAIKRDILWRQRNREFMDAVKHWRKLLFVDKGWRITFPPSGSSHFD